MAYRNKEKEKENKRQYHLKNRELLIKRAKKWRIDNIERFTEYQRRYRKSSKIREITAKKKVR